MDILFFGVEHVGDSGVVAILEGDIEGNRGDEREVEFVAEGFCVISEDANIFGGFEDFFDAFDSFFVVGVIDFEGLEELEDGFSTFPIVSGHIFDDAGDFDIVGFEDGDAAFDVGEGEFGGGCDDDGGIDFDGLEDGEVSIAGSWGHIDDEVIMAGPIDFPEELVNDAGDHWTAPHEGLIFFDHEADAEHGETVNFGRDDEISDDDGGQLLTDESGDARAVEIEIEECDVAPELFECEGGVERDGAFSDAAFTGANDPDVFDARDGFFGGKVFGFVFFFAVSAWSIDAVDGERNDAHVGLREFVLDCGAEGVFHLSSHVWGVDFGDGDGDCDLIFDDDDIADFAVALERHGFVEKDGICDLK